MKIATEPSTTVNNDIRRPTIEQLLKWNLEAPRMLECLKYHDEKRERMLKKEEQ